MEFAHYKRGEMQPSKTSELQFEWTYRTLWSCNPNCGGSLWRRVAFLNMSNSSQRCPSAWRVYNSSGVRGCTRSQISFPSCPATFYATSRQYSRVCGRVIGHQIGGTDAFGHLAVGDSIDSYYVYGVSVTHGAPRNHIWTLAASITDGAKFIRLGWECPCVDPSHPGNVFPPSFVGNNYYCESGNPTGSGAGHAYTLCHWPSLGWPAVWRPVLQQ